MLFARLGSLFPVLVGNGLGRTFAFDEFVWCSSLLFKARGADTDAKKCTSTANTKGTRSIASALQACVSPQHIKYPKDPLSKSPQHILFWLLHPLVGPSRNPPVHTDWLKSKAGLLSPLQVSPAPVWRG